MFVNFTNHPSSKWSKMQHREASKYGEVTDISFPNIGSTNRSEEILAMASEYVDRLLDMTGANDAIMVQGEFTFTFAVVDALLRNDRHVVAACSERVVHEEWKDDGTCEKIVKYQFTGFRDYSALP